MTDPSNCSRLVKGLGRVYICSACAENSKDLFKALNSKWVNNENGLALKELPKPKEIKAMLDQYVVGQEEAKKTLSVAVYNHYKRINAQDKNTELQKRNVLMLGPTGSGKTLLAQTLARILYVPCAICDATTLTETGYCGDDVETILLKLLRAADYDVKKAERGIIYIDEIDKIARKTATGSVTHVASGLGLQDCLLKLLEGKVASVKDESNGLERHFQIDTTNILFLVGGAFDGLETIIESSLLKREKTIGFTSVKVSRDDEPRDLLKETTPKDLIRYGLTPEFVGRVPILVKLEGLTEDDMIEIITEPKNAILKQYQILLQMDRVDLKYTEQALRAIARFAFKQNVGARGLPAIIETVLFDIMYESPSSPKGSKYVITEELVESKITHAINSRRELRVRNASIKTMK